MASGKVQLCVHGTVIPAWCLKCKLATDPAFASLYRAVKAIIPQLHDPFEHAYVWQERRCQKCLLVASLKTTLALLGPPTNKKRCNPRRRKK